VDGPTTEKKRTTHKLNESLLKKRAQMRVNDEAEGGEFAPKVVRHRREGKSRKLGGLSKDPAQTETKLPLKETRLTRQKLKTLTTTTSMRERSQKDQNQGWPRNERGVSTRLGVKREGRSSERKR